MYQYATKTYKPYQYRLPCDDQDPQLYKGMSHAARQYVLFRLDWSINEKLLTIMNELRALDTNFNGGHAIIEERVLVSLFSINVRMQYNLDTVNATWQLSQEGFSSLYWTQMT